MAPPEAAQEGAQGGGRLSRETENAGGPAGAQRIGVVDAVATGQRGGHQRHHLVTGVGSAFCMAQVQAPVNQLGQAKAQGEGGRKNQPGIGHQAVIVEGDADAVGLVACYSFCLEEHPLATSALTRRPPSVDSGSLSQICSPQCGHMPLRSGRCCISSMNPDPRIPAGSANSPIPKIAITPASARPAMVTG